MSTNVLALDNFLRIVEANKENSHCILLGAGVSRNSGVPTEQARRLGFQKSAQPTS